MSFHEENGTVEFEVPITRADATRFASQHAVPNRPFPIDVKMALFPKDLTSRITEMKKQIKAVLGKTETVKSRSDVVVVDREILYIGGVVSDENGHYSMSFYESIDQIEGWGVVEWKDGRTYKGEWIHGRMNGVGIYEWPNQANSTHTSKSLSSSSKANEKSQAKSQVKNKNCSYEGEWKDDCMHGWGTYRWGTDRAYEGQWKKDMMHGHGILDWPGNSQYRGEFYCDKISGRGVKVWADGSIYGGDWRNDKRHGDGIYIWPEAKGIYHGEWFEDTAHGSGKMVWYFVESGINKEACYEGEWFKDKRHGKGVYTWPDGTKFEGEWSNDEMKDGTYTYPDGLTF
eukprot:TRINITY_DN3453_c0_g1_i1.p1 TRINITY_DN3453_c0_g1~~TRINITY_DN3453_c0_g1_i1.p1  ORF type:complete len:343 (+),score=63.64 TRINITY_DN3453_c0_g1_i1:143-1171(+)